MLQRIFDPFNGAGSDENGTIVMNIDDRDLAHYQLDNEDRMRQEYEYYKQQGEALEIDEDEEAVRIATLRDMEHPDAAVDVAHFENVVRKELGIFEDNEEYSFNKDLKKAYHRSLAQSTEQ